MICVTSFCILTLWTLSFLALVSFDVYYIIIKDDDEEVMHTLSYPCNSTLPHRHPMDRGERERAWLPPGEKRKREEEGSRAGGGRASELRTVCDDAPDQARSRLPGVQQIIVTVGSQSGRLRVSVVMPGQHLLRADMVHRTTALCRYEATDDGIFL
ncbi:hypothetical protein L249_3782 [Ophiocordyceps polyrhachis-furcata BCC 54312]|uniref:Uncharacterized protein n=1 Tax=Ophiocordyceps polyrhachis-furcata BCC 54312 TaxID=1330021 RepID=A0A367KYV7_9HYPO|nr:hypothetical protein L249_3782 [Ophiocordyceps polyrhachis-furcata BCC 54312]